MKKQRFKKLGKEEGFFSAFVLVFLVTLGIMGVGASMLVQSESKNIINQINCAKSDYLIEGAAFYCAGAISAGRLTSDTTFTIENMDVDVDTLYDAGALIMEVTVTLNDDQQRTIRYEMQDNPLWRYAVYVAGSVNNTTARDSDGVTDPDLIVENKSPLPTVDNSTLNSMSSTQGHDRSEATFSPTDDYPNGSFYYTGATPNVIHVYGNMNVAANIDIYGIYLVEGNVSLDRRANVHAIIYLVNPGRSVAGASTNFSRNDVEGAIFGNGSVTAGGSRSLRVVHRPDWMRVFTQFVDYTGGMKIADWSY